MEAYPMKLQARSVYAIWGGKKINERFGKPIPPEGKLAETWELADLPAFSSPVSNGPLAGKTIGELVRVEPEPLVGAACLDAQTDSPIPIVLKFIDAADQLSVQVHPDDEFARKHENRPLGKTEAWYVLDAEPEARVIVGLKPDVTREVFEEHLKAGHPEECMNVVSVKPGDLIFLPAGTIHTVGHGALIFEIQQACDITYRLWDWGRVDRDGKPRELHVDKALAAATFGGPPPRPEPVTLGDLGRTLVACPQFRLDELQIERATELPLFEDRFHALTFLEGEATIEGGGERVEARPGDTLMIPAALRSLKIEPKTACRILRSIPGNP